MKKLPVRQIVYVTVGASLLLIGCSYIPFYNNEKPTDTDTTPDTVTEEILSEFETALLDGVPTSNEATAAALKSKGLKQEAETISLPNLTEEEVAIIIQAGRDQAVADGIEDISDVTKILPSIIKGCAGGIGEIGVSSNVALSEEVDALKIIAQASVDSLLTRQDATFIPDDSVEDSSRLGTAMSRISESCTNHLPDVGVGESDLPDSAAAIAQTIVSNMDNVVSNAADAPAIASFIAQGAGKGLDISGLSSDVIQNSLGKVSAGMTAGFSSINKSKLPILDNYAEISGMAQSGLMKGTSLHTNHTYSADEISNIGGSIYNKAIEEFSKSKEDGLTLDLINTISKKGSSVFMEAAGSYFPSFKQDDYNKISSSFMEQTLKSVDYLSTNRADFTADAMNNYAGSMIAGYTNGAGTVAQLKGLDKDGAAAMINSGVSGYTKGASSLASLKNENIADFIASGSEKCIGAMNEFINKAGYTQGDIGTFVSKASGSFISNVGNINRTGYDLQSNLGSITNKISDRSAQGLASVKYNGAALDQSMLNDFIQGMSKEVSGNISNIKIDGKVISGSLAKDVLGQSSQGFTTSFSTLQTQYQKQGFSFDPNAALDYMSRGQTEGSKDLVSLGLSQAEITGSISSGINTGSIGGTFQVSSSVTSNLNMYYSQYIGTQSTGTNISSIGTEDTTNLTPVLINAIITTVPADKAVGITFSDTDFTAGELGGALLITKAANEGNIIQYRVYWGSSASTKLSGQSVLAQIAKTGGNVTYTIPENTQLPSNATHLLVFTYNSVGEMTSGVSVAIVDNSVPGNFPQGISFTDTNNSANTIAGNVSITRALDESDTTHYRLYWGSGPTTKLVGQSVIAEIATTGGNLIYAIPNTAIPTSATHFLVFTKNASGEAPTGVSVAITDVVASSNANLSALTLSSGTVAPAFSAAITSYTASVGIGTSSITVTPTKEQSGASITVNGTSVTSGNASSSITMNLGTNTITVVVTAEDLSTQKTYIITVTRGMTAQEAYMKASNTEAVDQFSRGAVAISGDTIVVGALGEDSNATGINGTQSDNSASISGAAYVFTRSGSTWSQQAYLKASNTEASDTFGYSVAIAGDTIVIGATGEDSNATGVNGTQTDNSASGSGAAYVFTRSGTTWSQQAYLKASNAEASDNFGASVAIADDTIVVGANLESSNATGVNGNQSDNSASFSGATYVFTRSGSTWSQQAYLKASNTEASDGFGGSVAISGNTVVVGATLEGSNATGVNGNQSNNSASNSGAAYVFTRSGSTWSQEAYLKASNTEASDNFGSVTISGDTIVVGANNEDSNATGVNGTQTDNTASNSGAVYVFTRSGSTWSQEAYIKASNTEASDSFSGPALSGDILVVRAFNEDSNATGINGIQSNNSATNSGAVYVFTRSGSTWSQHAYVKASNTEAADLFGDRVAISNGTIVVGAYGEDSNATGVNGNQSDNSTSQSGAVYVFK